MNTLKRLEMLLFLYTKKSGRSPESIDEMIQNEYMKQVGFAQKDPRFLSDSGDLVEWMYDGDSIENPKNGEEIVICSPESNAGKWLLLNANGEIKVVPERPIPFLGSQ